MTILVNTLLREQQIILDRFEELKKIHGELTPGTRLKVKALNLRLKTFFKKEDKYLYSPLFHAAKEDARLKSNLQAITREPEAESRDLQQQLEAYESGGDYNIFSSDISRLQSTFKDRAKRGKGLFYREFDRVVPIYLKAA